jgi:hypothetical protein
MKDKYLRLRSFISALEEAAPFQWSRPMIEHTYALAAVWYKLPPKKERR